MVLYFYNKYYFLEPKQVLTFLLQQSTHIRTAIEQSRIHCRRIFAFILDEQQQTSEWILVKLFARQVANGRVLELEI